MIKQLSDWKLALTSERAPAPALVLVSDTPEIISLLWREARHQWLPAAGQETFLATTVSVWDDVLNGLQTASMFGDQQVMYVRMPAQGAIPPSVVAAINKAVHAATPERSLCIAVDTASYPLPAWVKRLTGDAFALQENKPPFWKPQDVIGWAKRRAAMMKSPPDDHRIAKLVQESEHDIETIDQTLLRAEFGAEELSPQSSQGDERIFGLINSVLTGNQSDVGRDLLNCVNENTLHLLYSQVAGILAEAQGLSPPSPRGQRTAMSRRLTSSVPVSTVRRWTVELARIERASKLSDVRRAPDVTATMRLLGEMAGACSTTPSSATR